MVLAGWLALAGNATPGWRGVQPRTLLEAARLAEALAASEHLAIGSASTRWHAESILKTIPVYDMHGGSQARVEPSPQHSEESAWRDLRVKREDFAHYVAWLRSIW